MNEQEKINVDLHKKKKDLSGGKNGQGTFAQGFLNYLKQVKTQENRVLQNSEKKIENAYLINLPEDIEISPILISLAFIRTS